jgi:exosortase N
MKSFPVAVRHRLRPSIIPSLAYVVIALAGMGRYLEWASVNFIIGVATMPLILSVKGSGKVNFRYAFLAMLLMIAGMFVPVKTILYLSLCCILLFLHEAKGRQLSALPLLSCMIIAPVCTYFTHVFSFPIRLWLTSAAGNLLKYINPDVTVAGNVISFDKDDFSVDPACMGLNMLVTSLLCGLVLLAIDLKRKGGTLALHWVLIALGLMTVLNVIANLVRILVLVYFKILPDNAMHEMVGIICLLVYVLWPGSLLIKALVRLCARPLKMESVSLPVSKGKLRLCHFLLFPMLILLALHTYNREAAPANGALPAVPGYRISWYDHDVIKMEDEHALIYVKPLKGFVYTDHNPLICWTGSGYQFKNVEEQNWNGIALFTGVLVKGKDKLYTAWWYDNGKMTTTDQWTWRWNMLRSYKAFSIVNVSANDVETLKREVAVFTAKRSILF